MGDDYTGEIAIITIGGASLVAILTLLCKYSFRMKCNEVNICYGACIITRDIPDELRAVENGGAQHDEIPAAVGGGSDENSSPSSRTPQFTDVFKPPKGARTGVNRHSI